MEPEILKFEDIIKGCLKSWKRVLVFTLLATIIGILVVSFTKEKVRYEGIFKVVVSQQNKDNDDVDFREYDTKLIGNYIELIRTQKFMSNVVKRMDLNVDEKTILSTLNLVNIDKSDFIQIKYTSPSEEQTIKVLEGIGLELKDISDENENVNIQEVEIIDIKELDESINKFSVLGIFVFGGFGLALATVFIMECIDGTFKTKGELERETKVKVLGNLPNVKNEKDLLINSKDIDKEYYEAFKSLVFDIKYGAKLKNLKSIALISSLDNEGSSTVCSNLALMLSNDRKVVLVDTKSDNKIEKIFNKIKESKNNLKLSYSENLDVITSKELRNKIKDFDSKEFVDFMDNLKSEYDYVIVNSSSIVGNSDYKAILSNLDAVILNVKAESTKKDIVKESLKNINYLGVELVGLIFNCGDRFRNKYN